MIMCSTATTVALRKESVDRNSAPRIRKTIKYTSLSARRAWIEIIMFVNLRVVDGVALRKESVDRNHQGRLQGDPAGTSLSARRAWIEIGTAKPESSPFRSLSARRAWIEIKSPPSRRKSPRCRSPQGERG